ncbi:MAG: hypothetical protein JOZ11_00180 [Alphaproteobacteria bacterium]|nr:hypothetical protein [Alphaproteobacteria bacterium]
MASGDPHRVWFEEMAENVAFEMASRDAFEATIRLRDDLDEMLQRIRWA